MIGRPQTTEAAKYYFTYIDRYPVTIPFVPLKPNWMNLWHCSRQSRAKNRCTVTRQKSGASGRSSIIFPIPNGSSHFEHYGLLAVSRPRCLVMINTSPFVTRKQPKFPGVST